MRLILASIAAVFVLGACAGSADQPPEPSSASGGANGSTSISAVDNEFEPTELKLAARKEVTVQFTNDGDTIQRFTSEELDFDSGSIEPRASADVTFTASDQDTSFVCTIHEESDDMVGTIVAD